MKDFEPIPAPPEDFDPWWKRLFAYTIFCVMIPVLCAGLVIVVVILMETGSGVSWFSRLSVEMQDIVLRVAMGAAAAIGFVGTLVYCFREEARVRKMVRTRGFR